MSTPINPIKTLMGIGKIAMEIITDEIENLKSAWKKTSEQQLFHELESEYGFPRATCRSLVQLMHEFIEQNYGNQREDKQILYRGSSDTSASWGHLVIFISNWNSQYGVMCP
jgi:ABC-type microcin C transport system permease subunit YejB